MFLLRYRHVQTRVQPTSCLAPTLAFAIVILTAVVARAQNPPPPPPFQAGQSMYIVAFRRFHFPLIFEAGNPVPQPEYINDDLDAERKVRKRIEQWQYFKIAEKPSQADFIFLVHLDESSIEGLAIPFEAYRRHFKENFDLDALREAALGRYLIGPLKLPTLSRLTDRLVKQFREKLTKSGP
jgi:hypothetical protein